MTILRPVAIAAVLLCFTLDADAQRYRRGVVYGSPYGGMTFSPYGFSVRTPYYSYGVSSPGYVAPRGYSVRYGWPGASVRVETGVSSPSPAPASSYNGQPSVRPSGPTPATYLEEAPRFKTPLPQGAAPADASDLNAQLAEAVAVLDARFADFDGGEGWRRYLTSDATATQEKLLRRMDSVAADAQFAAVSSLPEFQRVHELLLQIAATTEPPAPARPALPAAPAEAQPELGGAELIPVPSRQPAAKPADTQSERSVLAR